MWQFPEDTKFAYFEDDFVLDVRDPTKRLKPVFNNNFLSYPCIQT